MATHTLTIPKWRPALLNEFVGGHWSVGHKLKKRDKLVVALHAFQQEIPHAAGRRRVSLEVALAGRSRPFDHDAPWKSLLDALSTALLLVDDSPGWVEQGTVTFTQGTELCSRIVLEDIDDGSPQVQTEPA